MKPPPRNRLWPRVSKALAMGCLVGTGIVLLGRQAKGILGDELAGLLLFHGRAPAEWNQIQPVTCTPWLRDVGFAGAPMSCDTALGLVGQHQTALTASGRRAHYITYDSDALPGGTQPLEPQSPVWLHLHGLNSNYLHGTRYLGVAKRAGFRLVSAEYVNHGLSDHDGKGAAYGCKESDDVVAVVKAVLARYPGSDVLITASSMGTMALALAEAKIAAADHEGRIKAFALENPPTTVRDLASSVGIGARLPKALIDLTLSHAAERAGYNFEECSPMAAYSRFSHPTLVQHAATDELLPPSMGERVYAALPSQIPKHFALYPKGSHSAVWNAQPDLFEKDLMDFFAQGQQWQVNKARRGLGPNAPISARNP